MKTCSICNAECRDEAIFCDACGHKFEEEAANAVEVEDVEVKTEQTVETEMPQADSQPNVQVNSQPDAQPKADSEPKSAPIPPVTPMPNANSYSNNYSGNNGGNNNNNNAYMGNDNYYNGHIIPNRNIALAVVLTIVTCGIYGIYWMIMLNDEVNAAAEEHNAMSGGIVFLLTLVTCGIYGWFWAYQMGQRVDRIKNDPNGSSNILYLILAIFGIQIVNYCLMQDTLNTKFQNNQ